MFLWNVGLYLQIYMVFKPRRIVIFVSLFMASAVQVKCAVVEGKNIYHPYTDLMYDLPSENIQKQGFLCQLVYADCSRTLQFWSI
jgi:hypothetical protein